MCVCMYCVCMYVYVCVCKRQLLLVHVSGVGMPFPCVGFMCVCGVCMHVCVLRKWCVHACLCVCM